MASAELVIAIVSLVIAVIAFWIATAQALQHGWGLPRRTFEPSELRFVVTYATPVLFVAPPANTRGPLSDKAVHKLEGTQESRSNTLTIVRASKVIEKKPSVFHRVGPTNDALASWVTLLHVLQDNEKHGRRWDADMRMKTPAGLTNHGPEYTMCVQIQKLDRNWDFIPDSITKPYATTSLVRVAEIAVIQGMSWRIFEPDTGDLSAESENITCSGFLVPRAGIVVIFTVTGKITQVANPSQRTIPDIRAKQLIFGSVLSIFDTKSRSGLDIPLLNFGDEQALRETLNGFAFSKEESDSYLAYEPRSRAINFEVISMMGQVFRIRGSSFKMLPNPNTGPWVDTFDACDLVQQFQRSLLIAKLEDQCTPALHIQALWTELLAPVWKKREEDIDIVMRDAVHDAIDECDKFLHIDDEISRVVVGIHMQCLQEQLEGNSRSSLDDLRRETTAGMLDVYKQRLEHSMSN
ncbi:uncharacterized protein CLAFUR5_09308 [Fulvia fulva]|uniref:Uncharacterized protein n=1 Tax=Passalora fulva TaxID=5499 RepID=A0A9Q8PFY7_PASFU|nr:uncharacterized protein CLAFUR5_09308 [Fulvia fulva]UJO21697.1 hypothetical protein CLAFUR5_09308 [Fulvia fulva]